MHDTTPMNEAFDGFMQAFETYRDTNEARLRELETRATSDVLLEDKLRRLDHVLDEAKSVMDRETLRLARPKLGQNTPSHAIEREHKHAFCTYVRSGESHGLKPLELKALSSNSGAEGGYLVPGDAERDILQRVAHLSPLRRLATVRTTSSHYTRPISLTAAESGWVAETAARPTTDSPTLAELNFPTAELYAMPAASQSLLDDAAIDVEQWLAEEVDQSFAEQESTAFITGNGTNKPKGILNYTTVDNASWEWNKVGTVLSGGNGTFAASNPGDALIDLVYSLKAAYRQNGVFLMNRKTQAALRKLKDGQGNYLWTPPSSAGAQAALMNFPVVESEDMPDMAANSLSIAFGDMRRAYLIVDRAGIRILRDPYSAKPYVLFYVTKRVGGGIQDFAAIKLMKFAAAA